MKKFLAILLIALLGLSCFACVDKEPIQSDTKVRRGAIDTIIKDNEGLDKCFWEDGSVYFNDYIAVEPQYQIMKNAILSVQTEYDMWYSFQEHDIALTNYYEPVEFEYDETKIEIKVNPDKDSHFILKLLEPCDNEKIIAKLTVKYNQDGAVLDSPITECITITVSANE